jgi:hypothetical protein
LCGALLAAVKPAPEASSLLQRFSELVVSGAALRSGFGTCAGEDIALTHSAQGTLTAAPRVRPLDSATVLSRAASCKVVVTTEEDSAQGISEAQFPSSWPNTAVRVGFCTLPAQCSWHFHFGDRFYDAHIHWSKNDSA